MTGPDHRTTELRLLAILALCAIALLTASCGGHPAGKPTASGQSQKAAASLARPIPGAPDTPRWLRVRIWRIARGLGDPHPTRVVVKMGLREHGRVVDRVWMRGTFLCDSCSHGLTGTPAPRGHLAGFTVDAESRASISFSLASG